MSKPSQFNFSIVPAAGSGVTIIRCTGNFTGQVAAKAVLAQVDQILRSKQKRIVLDARTATPYDSATAGAMVGACKAAENAGARLNLVCEGEIYDCFFYTKCVSFGYFKTEEEAINNLVTHH